MSESMNRSTLQLGRAYDVHRGKCKLVSALVADGQKQNLCYTIGGNFHF